MHFAKCTWFRWLALLQMYLLYISELLNVYSFDFRVLIIISLSYIEASFYLIKFRILGLIDLYLLVQIERSEPTSHLIHAIFCILQHRLLFRKMHLAKCMWFQGRAVPQVDLLYMSEFLCF